MRVCVLGAGVVGLATAWALSEAGCEVVVIDAAAQPGLGASAGNGAQLSYNFVAPLASPDTLLHLPALLFERDGPLQIKPRLNTDFLRWGLGFLRASTSRMVRETTEAQLALAALSHIETDAVERDAGIGFYRRVAGKLVVYRHPATFATARRQAEAQRGIGAEQSVLSPLECLQKEPGLRIDAALLQGGVFTASEELGDCAAFCKRLAAKLQTRNTVTFMMGAPATPILREGRLVAVQAGGDEVRADHFVLSLGVGARGFAKACGIHLNIEPMKGYSLTLRPRAPSGELQHSVTDADRKIVFAPLDHETGPVIRVAGIADFMGNDRSINPKRLATIRNGAAEALDVDLASDPVGWTGLRPVTPDSRPIIGPSPLPGLFLNTGHGGLGWTLACGSARLARELLLGQEPSVNPTWFALKR